MLFNSINFWIFFPIVVLIYFIIPKKGRYIWLLIASYYFYMCWNAKYVLLILISTLVTWISGNLIQKSSRVNIKKLVVAGCFCINIGMLFFFKYFDFLLSVCNGILKNANMQLLDKPFDVLLPVGISFYTFQALSYTMDVYRKKVEPEKNILRYALFVSFFPQLVAGPIERSDNLLKQIREAENNKVWNYENITNGLILMVWGLFQKMVIADRVAILVDTVFESYYSYGAIALLTGAVGFAIQIYCDFASYSTIAIGAAKVLGFTLMENFETPYFAKSIREFWHRWHISLSTWFRDYLYIPLGGNRGSKAGKYFNKLLTFTISGLWHGANWTFLMWGFIHGIYQIIGEITKPLKQRLNAFLHTKTESISYKLGQAFLTFLLVDAAWIFFRSDSIGDALYYCKRIITKWDPWSLFNGEIYTLGLDRFEFNVLLVSIAVLFLADLIRYKKRETIAMFLKNQCIWFRWTAIILLVAATLVYGIYGTKFDSSQFIYFQF